MARAVHFRWGGQGFWPIVALAILALTTFPAELIANDRPLAVHYVAYLYFPVFRDYPETTFGGDFETAADFTDSYLRDQIARHGRMLEPLIPFSPSTPIIDLPDLAPTPPSDRNWLGTDSRQHDVLARLIYGVRASLILGLIVTAICSGVTILAKRVVTATFYLPAIAVALLAALDFAGQGPRPSLGALLHEGLGYPNAPWLGLSGAFGLAVILVPLVFLARALRHALSGD